MSRSGRGLASLLGIFLLGACMANVGNPTESSDQSATESPDNTSGTGSNSGTSSNTGTATGTNSGSNNSGQSSNSGSNNSGSNSNETDAGSSGSGASNGASADAGAGGATADDCTEKATAAQKVFSDNCAGCHSAALASGGFGVADDLDAMVQMGLIVPGDPEGSPVYAKIAAGAMPPSGALDGSAKATLEAWITCIH